MRHVCCVLCAVPCRFRPPSVMGDQKYEHTQNITLQRILQAVINLQSIHQDMAAVDAQQVTVCAVCWASDACLLLDRAQQQH